MENVLGGAFSCMREYMVCESMDWTDLGQDRSNWRAAVNTVTNLYIP
jgi:hypothetical protein